MLPELPSYETNLSKFKKAFASRIAEILTFDFPPLFLSCLPLLPFSLRLIYKQSSWNLLIFLFAIKIESFVFISNEILTRDRKKVSKESKRIIPRAHVCL